MVVDGPGALNVSPIPEALGEFLGSLERRGASLNTITAYRNDLRQLVRFLDVTRPGEAHTAFDRSTIEEFVAGLRGRGYRDTSVARKLAAARSFFAFLIDARYLNVNPADGLTVPRAGRILPRPITAPEAERLLAEPARRSSAEAKRDLAMLELLYATGMRVSELVSLDTSNIHLERKSAYVRCLGARGEERTIIIPRRTQDSLQDYLSVARPRLLHGREERALFVNRRGGRLTRQGLWLILKGYTRAAGLPADITPHTLRHSFAAEKLGAGMSLGNVQRILGHSAPSSTRVYSAFTKQGR